MVIPGEDPKALEKGDIPHLGGSLPTSMRFVKDHPDMRIKRRSWDIPANLQKIPICEIKLYKKDGKPTRIKGDNIEIWTSDTNNGYKRKIVNFEFSEEIVPAACDFADFEGKVITETDSPVRVLTLSGLNIKDKYILVTTNFEEGPADFDNSEFHILEAFGPDSIRIPVSIGLNCTLWQEDQCNFRTTGIVFDDSGYGRDLLKLDAPNTSGNEGFIAFTRGGNDYLPTALCESYREVRDFWMGMVRECLDAGVDGVDFRIENHSTHTSDPFSYGYNEVILEEYQQRYGAVNDERDYDIQKIAKVRGDFYTEFLKNAKALIHSQGKSMQVHLNTEFFRPDPLISRRLAYPWNITFDWQEWIDEGILDEASLRTYLLSPDFILADAFSNEMIKACCDRNIPMHYNRYMFFEGQKYAEEMEQIYMDGRFQSFVIYETANIIKSDGNKGVIIKEGGYLEAMRKKAEQLGII